LPSRTGFATPSETFKYAGIQNVSNGVANPVTLRSAASAAGEIKNLIAVSVEKVEDGSKLVIEAGLTMEEIVNSIYGVTAIMSEISAASVEQTAGIKQVNLAICQMDDVTQQNAILDTGTDCGFCPPLP
jgi:hypothetical protein